jgi:hypothetical protein
VWPAPSYDCGLLLQSQTRQLFVRSIREIAAEVAPNDVNALDVSFRVYRQILLANIDKTANIAVRH